LFIVIGVEYTYVPGGTNTGQVLVHDANAALILAPISAPGNSAALSVPFREFTLSDVPDGWVTVWSVDGVRLTPLVGAPIGPCAPVKPEGIPQFKRYGPAPEMLHDAPEPGASVVIVPTLMADTGRDTRLGSNASNVQLAVIGVIP
jgi:hypothetical protein